MRAQTDANVSAHSSPRARRRIPATGATPRGQYSNHSGPTQMVLEAEENLSDKEMFYGSAYASVPRAGERPATLLLSRNEGIFVRIIGGGLGYIGIHLVVIANFCSGQPSQLFL